MAFKELGSEFWIVKNSFAEKDKKYVLAGRTAIDLIIQDMIACGGKHKSVCLPAYCCESMLQPFIDRGIDIQFYDVTYEKGELKYYFNDQTADILYVSNYFGYNNTLPVSIVRDYKLKGVTVLYDRTHSLFSDDHFHREMADYCFASIRKWMGVPCGAYFSKNKGNFSLAKLEDCPYLKEKVEAMQMKAAYMRGDISVEKQQFLKLYGNFAHHLSEDYRNYGMDGLSLQIWQDTDLPELRTKRNANAAYLQNNLKEIPQIKLMFSLTENDCALFVPVLFATKNVRDDVRKYLINHSIYCPVHWPKPSLIPSAMRANDLYDRELSLLCDQRYGIEDMQRIVDTIKEYFEIKKYRQI